MFVFLFTDTGSFASCSIKNLRHRTRDDQAHIRAPTNSSRNSRDSSDKDTPRFASARQDAPGAVAAGFSSPYAFPTTNIDAGSYQLWLRSIISGNAIVT